MIAFHISDSKLWQEASLREIHSRVITITHKECTDLFQQVGAQKNFMKFKTQRRHPGVLYNIRYKIQKGTSAQRSIFYYHIGVKMDNMFRPSSGHHQVQYKEMWGSTELRTLMGCHSCA